MSSNNDISPVMVEYINLLRELMLYHNNMVISYSRTTETLSTQLSQMIQNINSNYQSNNNFTQSNSILDNSSRYNVMLSLNLLKHDFYPELNNACPNLSEKSEPSSFYISVN